LKNASLIACKRDDNSALKIKFIRELYSNKNLAVHVYVDKCRDFAPTTSTISGKPFFFDVFFLKFLIQLEEKYRIVCFALFNRCVDYFLERIQARNNKRLVYTL
jgi:hypothetical protein